MKKVLILSLCSFVAAVAFGFLEARLYPLVLREEIRVVPSEEITRLLCLDHRGFAADVFFIKVNLHSGSLMWKPLAFQFDSDWSYGMMDLVTNLDPKYYTAYLFSAMGLIHNFDDVKRAQPIIEKGMKVFPESWELPFWMGYDYYVYLEEYEIASKYLWQSAQKPNAPKAYLALLLSVFRKGGAYDKALWALEAMLGETDDNALKMVYQKKLIQLQNLAFLQGAVHEYQRRCGRFPSSLDALIKEAIIPKLPEDPMGMQYQWDGEQKRVVVR